MVGAGRTLSCAHPHHPILSLFPVTPPLPPQNDGDTPLHMAARGGYEKIIGALLAAGADPNATNNKGDMPLFEAADRGAEEAVRVLLAAGADANATDKKGRTYIEVLKEGMFFKAAKDGDLAAVQLAVETHKMDPNCKDVRAAPFPFPCRPILRSHLTHPSLSCVSSIRALASLLSIGLQKMVTLPWCSTSFQRPRQTWRRKR